MQIEESWQRRFRALRERAEQFSTTHSRSLGLPIPDWGTDAPRALFISSSPPRTETEVCLMKALAVAGWSPIPVIMMDPEVLRAYYRLINPREMHEWSTYRPDPQSLTDQARAVVQSCRTIDDLKAFEAGGVRLGGNAISFARREKRIGTVEFDAPGMRELLAGYVAGSMAAAQAAAAVFAATKPSLVFAIDTVYTPKGEIFDSALAQGIPFIRWFPAHKSNALMLKRYSLANRDADLNSLSETSWRSIRHMPWAPALADEVERELRGAYAKGDWYGESATQFDRRILERDAARAELGLDTSKKLAVIFPHICWDASFGRGQDLFSDYEEWLVETVRAAIANPRVQWLIKVHPAHAGKSEIDFWKAESSEDRILRERFGTLPPHVKVMPSDSRISTYSIFPLMDWGLTVRGTTGLEAARLGVPVLTGGTGRYDRRGFTIDSATREEYLGKIAGIHTIPRLTAGEQELANRFAYGLFRLRPLPLSTIALEYDRKYGVDAFFNGVDIHNHSIEDWTRAPDLAAFADWATSSTAEDYLLSPARAAAEPVSTNATRGLFGSARRWLRAFS